MTRVERQPIVDSLERYAVSLGAPAVLAKSWRPFFDDMLEFRINDEEQPLSPLAAERIIQAELDRAIAEICFNRPVTARVKSWRDRLTRFIKGIYD